MCIGFNGIKIPFLHPRKVAHDGLLRVIIPTYLTTVLTRQYSGSRTDPKERDPAFERRCVCWGWTPRLSLRWWSPERSQILAGSPASLGRFLRLWGLRERSPSTHSI